MALTTRRVPSIAAFAAAFLLIGAFVVPARAVLAGDPPKPPDGTKPGTPPPANPPANPPGNPPGNPPAPPPGAPPVAPPGAVPAAPPPAKVPWADAQQELAHLQEFLKNKKADTQDILGAMEAVMKAYPNNIEEPPADSPAGKTFAEDKKLFLEGVEKGLLHALGLVKPNPKTDSNDRDDVNIKAATLLANVRPEVHDTMVKDIETFIDKGIDANRKLYKTIPTSLYDEIFKTLGLLSNKKNGVYDYLMKNWITGDQSGDKPDMIKAAHEGMALMKDVPGAKRFEMVKQMVTLYSGTEHTAESYHPGGTTQSGAKTQNPKAFWDKIKGSVIKALQVLCREGGVAGKEPKEKDGALIASAGKFDEWFRDHKNVKRDPWVDAEKVADQTPPPPAANPPK